MPHLAVQRRLETRVSFGAAGAPNSYLHRFREAASGPPSHASCCLDGGVGVNAMRGPAWLITVPTPRTLDNRRQLGPTWRPAEELARLVTGRYEARGVSAAAWRHFVRDRNTRYGGGGRNHVVDGEALTVTQIEGVCTFVAIHEPQCQGMCLGKVLDVDIVPHAGAVGGVVIVAEDLQRRPVAQRRSEDVGDQVRLAGVGLANALVGQGACRIEVAQVHRA